MIFYFCGAINYCEHIGVKQILSKILTCFVLLIYLIGLSNFLFSRLIHEVHHVVSHTLSQHHGHSHGGYEEHGHSHNSFVDYSLFIEDKKKGTSKDDTALPNIIEIDYSNHLVTFNLFQNVFSGDLSIKYSNVIGLILKQVVKPPYPPPKHFLYILS